MQAKLIQKTITKEGNTRSSHCRCLRRRLRVPMTRATPLWRKVVQGKVDPFWPSQERLRMLLLSRLD